MRRARHRRRRFRRQSSRRSAARARRHRASVSTASRRTTTSQRQGAEPRAPRATTELRARRGRPAHGRHRAVARRRRRGVPPGRAGRRAAVVVGRLRRLRRPQRARDAAPARSGRQRARPSARVVYASSSSVYGNQARYPTRRDRPAEAVQPVRRHEARGRAPVRSLRRELGRVARCRCATSPCSVRGSGPTCRSTGCARPRSTARRSRATATARRSASSPTSTTSCAATSLAAERDVAPGTYCNLAGGGEITLNELIDLVGELAGAPVDDRRSSRGRPATRSATAARSTGRASCSVGRPKCRCATASARAARVAPLTRVALPRARSSPGR